MEWLEINISPKPVTNSQKHSLHRLGYDAHFIDTWLTDAQIASLAIQNQLAFQKVARKHQEALKHANQK